MLIEPDGPNTESQPGRAKTRRSRLRSASDTTANPHGRLHHDAGEWAAFGQLLEERREQLGLSRRHAARRAGITEREWKTLETGLGSTVSSIGDSVRLLPNPSEDELTRIADALEMPRDALFGDTANGAPSAASADGLSARVAMLPPRDRALVNDLVSRLLRDAR